MGAIILDGRAIADEINQKTHELIIKKKLPIGLASILVGNNVPSQTYINLKEKAAKKIGINFIKHEYPENFSPEIIIQKIQELNANKSIHGILVQLPLPQKFDEYQVLKTINPFKDVDCLHPKNLGSLIFNRPYLLSPMILAVNEVLKRTNLFPTKKIETEITSYEVADLKGVSISLIGYGLLVGRPLSIYFSNQKATVCTINRQTLDLDRFTLRSDIVITGTNSQDILQPNQLRNKSILIDVGNDIDTQKFLDQEIYFCKNPGGIGPITIAQLLSNTVQIAIHEKPHNGSTHQSDSPTNNQD